ncbi:hypothetical protein MY11210_002918 [Beauveria gryllotalpidicola]
MSSSTDADDTGSIMPPESAPPPTGLSTPTTPVEGKPIMAIWLRLQLAVKANMPDDPTPGDTLIIIDNTYGRVLACHPGGHLILDNIDGHDMRNPVPERWKWLCTETEGFIGFRSLTEDKFLGHDVWRNFVVRAIAQGADESFLLIKRRDGYRIQSLSWSKFKPLSARSDGAGVETGQSDGTSWEFMKVREWS